MAKYELSIYDENDNIIKTYQRNKCSVELYLKFQEYSIKVTESKVKNDAEFFKGMKGLFLEMFPAMTEVEYKNNTDVAEIIVLFRTIVAKATHLTNEKNG